MFRNKLKVFNDLNELNRWSAWWTVAHSLIPLWLQFSDTLVITQCNNPEHYQTRWILGDISSKSQYSCRRGSDHSWVWFARFHGLCFFWNILWFQVYSVDVLPIVMKRPKHKTPFVTLVLFCFLCLF